MSKTNFLILLCLIVFYCLFPGNISWINDEPVLVWNALHWNEIKGVAHIGLVGSKAIPFGSVPTIIYQLLLIITDNNLIMMVILKAICFVLMIYFSTLQICKTLDFNRKLAFLPLLSPFVFHYSRILWDNCFILPIAFLMLALLLEQIQNPNRLRLICLFFIATILLQIHLTSLMLIVPSFGFLFCKQSKWFLANFTLVGSAIFLSLLINYPYLDLVLNVLLNGLKNDQVPALLHIFSGFYYFSGTQFFEYMLPEVLGSHLGLSAIIAGMISVMAVAFYLLFVCWDCYLNWKKRESSAPIQLLLTILFTATIISYFGKLESFPHYLHSLAPVYAVLIIYGVNLILGWRFGRVVNLLYVSSLIALMLIFQTYIWQFDGNKTINYGATLSNQIEVMKAVKLAGKNPEIMTNVTQYQYFPYAYLVILTVLPETNISESKQKIFVTYAEPYSASGRIIAIKKSDR